MDLIKLLIGSEGKTLEFKRDLSSHLGIVRTIIAFANTAGGTLVIGVEDKTRHVIGITDPLLVEEKITSIINDSISPQILPELEILRYKKTQVISIHIYPSSLRPHFLKNTNLEKGTYVRVGSTNRLADIALIQEIKRFALNQSYDEQPFTALGSDAIDFKAASEIFSPFRKLKPTDLEMLRLVMKHQGKTVPTIAGMLLFGKKREQFFPDAWIQAGRFLGTTKKEILDTTEIRSYPALAIEEAIGFVQKHATMAMEIGLMRRSEHWSVPLKAVREVIINAVSHADYSQLGAPIRLSIFHDRLEVENPGLLPFGLVIEDLSKGVSKLRNRIIGRIFKELQLIEQWGSGIQRIIEECRDAGLDDPKFEEIGSHFRVTIFIEPEKKPHLDGQDQAILELLKETEGLSTLAISKKINLSPRATRTRLALLAERGFIVEVGAGLTDPTRRYFLRESYNMLKSSKFESYLKVFLEILNKYHCPTGEIEKPYPYDQSINFFYATQKLELAISLGEYIKVKNPENGFTQEYRFISELDFQNRFEKDIKSGIFSII